MRSLKHGARIPQSPERETASSCSFRDRACVNRGQGPPSGCVNPSTLEIGKQEISGRSSVKQLLPLQMVQKPGIFALLVVRAAAGCTSPLILQFLPQLIMMILLSPQS
jgi:hypothetical protein